MLAVVLICLCLLIVFLCVLLFIVAITFADLYDEIDELKDQEERKD